MVSIGNVSQELKAENLNTALNSVKYVVKYQLNHVAGIEHCVGNLSKMNWRTVLCYLNWKLSVRSKGLYVGIKCTKIFICYPF